MKDPLAYINAIKEILNETDNVDDIGPGSSNRGKLPRLNVMPEDYYSEGTGTGVMIDPRGLRDGKLQIPTQGLNEGGIATPKRGFVDEPGSYAGDHGPNISEYKSGGEQIGYRVRTRKVGGGTEKAFSINKYGSLDKALEAAKKYRKNFLGDIITNEDYLKLRNKNKEMSTSEFSKYLQEETTFKPRRGTVFNRSNVKIRDQNVGFESTRIMKKRTLGPKIEEEIYQKYLKRIKDGKAEGTIIGLGRDYLPGETRSTQEKTISRILREKGVDRSQFKKVNINNKKTIPKDQKRKNILFEKKKRAGSDAGQLSDEIILDIKAMNKKVANMSLENIAANKKYINSMRINATMDNLSKGVIPFDKYKELSDLEVAGKIKDRAKANKFFDVEHISSVKGQKTNIYYPNNIQMAPGQFGSLMDNFKRIANEQPNNAVLSEVDKILSDYGLTVRNPKNNVRLGNKNVIEVKNGMSNIVQNNFNSIDTPFEKQTITKATPMRDKKKVKQLNQVLLNFCPRAGKSTGASVTKCTPQEAANNMKKKLVELKQGKLPIDEANKVSVNLNKVAKVGARVGTKGALATLGPLGVGGDFFVEGMIVANDYLGGMPGKEAWFRNWMSIPFGGGADKADAMEMERIAGTEPAANRYKTAMESYNKLIKLYDRESEVDEGQLDQFDLTSPGAYDIQDALKAEDDVMNQTKSIIKQREKGEDIFKILKQGSPEQQAFERRAEVENVKRFQIGLDQDPFARGVIERRSNISPALTKSYAGGGLAKIAGERFGKPPEAGPTPQGLASILKRDR